MLMIIVPPGSYYNKKEKHFYDIPETVLELEHSLVAISEWESKYHKAFISDEKRSVEETLYYIQCMTLNNVDEHVYMVLSKENFDEIADYINDKRTATVLRDANRGGVRQTITSETIYYWMNALSIPFDKENWHLNKLLTLIRYISAKNAPKKKMSRQEKMDHYKQLNDQRRRALNSKG